MMEQWSIGFQSWTSRPYERLITGSSFAAFVLCRLNCHPVRSCHTTVDGIGNE
ncbi:hypothetical protein [Phocaeicola sartorii]|uniref:hypothetical protein n=1 Tax=Phocaeicola sartorii TaxID=671267 RepID=UPI0026EB37A6|nr:hypothetical protein [Phocaeicola sartorii]